MEEEPTTCASDAPATSDSQSQTNDVPTETKSESEELTTSDISIINIKEESGVVLNGCEKTKCFLENETGEVNDVARSLEDLDSLPAGDELVLGATGSDSGVEGCGRALSSGGGSRSCASSVVSCGSGCGSESSSLAGAPPRPRRRVNVIVTEPKRCSPLGSSTPRPVTAPRGPNLATRERARSREKPTLPEKPRPLTPKPRIRPTTDLPNLVRESPALRAKPTKTSSARCRTPNSPSEEKRWPSNSRHTSTATDVSATRMAADKYGTLPRRRRDVDSEGSPKHESTPPVRRPTVTRSVSSRSATKTRVRIYAEKTSQTVLLGTDVEQAFAGVLPNIESRIEVTRCHKGVQASSRDSELSRLTAAVAAAEALAVEERSRREMVEAQLSAERSARLAAIAELESNSQRLLELAGTGAAGADADGCLRALEEQLKSTGELASKQRAEIDSLRECCNKLNSEACNSREAVRSLEARLKEAEREALEMQDFLAAETGALGDSLRDTEADLARANAELDKRRAECRQLVRMCEQRRQEALAARARVRSQAGAARALARLAERTRALTCSVARAYELPRDLIQPTVFYNTAYSRSDSGEALTPDDPPGGAEVAGGGGLLAAVSRALRANPDLLRHDNNTQKKEPEFREDPGALSDDNSAELLDSETEPCLVTDPEYAEEWWSGAEGVEGAGAWSGDELSPEREFCADIDKDVESSISERDSLRNLSAAIAHRQRSEAEDGERASLLELVLRLDSRLGELLAALSLLAHPAAAALKDKLDVTEKNVADVVVKKLAELEATKTMMEQYKHSVETLKKQLAQTNDDDFDCVEEELLTCPESERRLRYEALDAALNALGSRPHVVRAWPRLANLQTSLERLAFSLASPPAANSHPHPLPTTA